MKRLVFILPFALALSACAKNPDAITPVSMGNAFATTDCRQASALLAREQASLKQLESMQAAAVAQDAVSVLLFAVPLSNVSGANKEGEIAAAKGKIIALETRMMTCGAPR